MSVTNFSAKFQVALENGASEVELAEIVSRYKALGLTQQDAYSALSQMRVYLCNRDRAETPICEILEAIMDRVWGYCSQDLRLWNTSLSERCGE